MPEMRSLQVRAHPQMILVMRWSIFRFVKMILSFRMSRVFSRTRVQARSQHISQFRGAGVHYLRKNMRAPDIGLLYLRVTRAKYIPSTTQLIDINTGLDNLDGHLRTDSYLDVPARLADCRHDACRYSVSDHVSSVCFILSIPWREHSFSY